MGKKFDIRKHEWTDKAVKVEPNECSDELIRFDNYMYLVDIEKKDAIAIAKHFKLTAEDLK